MLARIETDARTIFLWMRADELEDDELSSDANVMTMLEAGIPSDRLSADTNSCVTRESKSAEVFAMPAEAMSEEVLGVAAVIVTACSIARLPHRLVPWGWAVSHSLALPVTDSGTYA
jgi:hypothetical protein